LVCVRGRVCVNDRGMVRVMVLFMFRAMVRFRIHIRVNVSILRAKAPIWFRTSFRF
jgi:hypothetical protein